VKVKRKAYCIKAKHANIKRIFRGVFIRQTNTKTKTNCLKAKQASIKKIYSVIA